MQLVLVNRRTNSVLRSQETVRQVKILVFLVLLTFVYNLVQLVVCFAKVNSIRVITRKIYSST